MSRSIVAVLLLAAAALSQARLTVSGRRDNTLYQDAQGTLSNGAGQQMFVGTSAAGQLRRGLLTFDLAGLLPPYVTLHSAVITLSVSQARGTGTVPVTLHSVDAAWGEGSSRAGGDESLGAPATPGDATWVHRSFPGAAWTNAGGDYRRAPYDATTRVGGVGRYQFSSAQLVADLQFLAWNPQHAFGWILVGDESENGTLRSFATREHPDPALRPSLTLTWTNPTAAIGFFGNTCGGFEPIPVGMCHLGNAGFAVEFVGGPPDGLGILLFATDDAKNPIPLANQCHLYLDPATLVPAGVLALTRTGAARVRMPIPDVRALMGTWAFTQLLAIDPRQPAAVFGSRALALFLAD
jgi:hypothetical protein